MEPDGLELLEETEAGDSGLREKGRGGAMSARVYKLVGSCLVLVVVVGISVAGWFPYDPTRPDVSAILEGPSAAHLFGTDSSGFDVLSRVLASPKHDVPLALGGTILSLIVGVPLGLLTSMRSKVSGLIMRCVDVFQAFPLVIIALALVVVTGNNLRNVIYAIGVINIPRFIRLVRNEGMLLQKARFMEAARVCGSSTTRILYRHVLPNVWSIVLVQCSLAAAYAMIVIASLNFLGIGVSPPTPTLGSMIQSGSGDIVNGQWWVVLFPSIWLFVIVMAFNGIAGALDRER